MTAGRGNEGQLDQVNQHQMQPTMVQQDNKDNLDQLLDNQLGTNHVGPFDTHEDQGDQNCAAG
jgi:hypothetical protein